MRMDLIPRLAQTAYSSSFCADCYKNDPGGPERKRSEVRAYASAALALAAEAPDDPRADRLRLTAALAHAGLAMLEGDRRAAVRHLGEATAFARTTGGGLDLINHQHLVHALLDAGERETVAAFYDALALHSDPGSSNAFTRAAQDIRNGRMPENYQRMRGRQVIAN